MTWLLIIKVVIISTCSEGFQFCPPARPLSSASRC